LYLVILASLFHSYYKYLEEGKQIPILGSFILIVIPFVLIHIILSWLSFQVWGVPIIIFCSLFLVFLMVVVLKEPRCTSVRTRSLGDDIKFEECLNGPINAWYNPLKKKIFVGNKILRFLDENELKAVYYHEEGHGRYGFWRLLILNRSLLVVWVILYLVGLTFFYSIFLGVLF